jgi:mannosyltransferase OCH1-like enzyme
MASITSDLLGTQSSVLYRPLEIPRLIHKIWVNGPASTIPEEIMRVPVESWRKHYPEYGIVIWDKAKIEQLMRMYYPVEFQAYQDIKPLAFKCDVARLCVLHRCGGIYSDLKQLSLERIDLENVEYLITHDRKLVFTQDKQVVQNCFFAVPAQSTLIANYLSRCVTHIQNRDYRECALGITGPTVFGETLKSCSLNTSRLSWLWFRLPKQAYIYELTASERSVVWPVHKVDCGYYRILLEGHDQGEFPHCINCEHQRFVASRLRHEFVSSWWDVNDPNGLKNVFTGQYLEVDGLSGWTLQLLPAEDEATLYHPASKLYLGALSSEIADVQCGGDLDDFHIYGAHGRPVIKHKYDNARGGDWTGVINANNYGVMWNERRVYGETHEPPKDQ